MSPSLILGSSSKRRLEIISSLKIDFKHHPTPFDEESFIWPQDCKKGVEELARLKARALAELYPKERILTADTIVFFENEVLGKPKNLSQAREFIFRLQGKKHEVLTAVCVLFDRVEYSGVESTLVEFASLSQSQIEKYIHSDIPYDKAGGYAIQGGIGSLLVKKIDGSYDTVVGLPLALVNKLLLKTGYDLWENIAF